MPMQPAVRGVSPAVPLDLLQFHGVETAEFCGQFGRPYMKAVRMAAGTDLLEWSRRFSAARALLLDAHVPGTPGGTGQTFDWRRSRGTFRSQSSSPAASTPPNVGRAIREVRHGPWMCRRGSR
jgi:phosphoribosylanthranilate isomerase